ncbi:MAG: WhiB family transcriptional regulator [Actinomycetota bacterium]
MSAIRHTDPTGIDVPLTDHEGHPVTLHFAPASLPATRPATAPATGDDAQLRATPLFDPATVVDDPGTDAAAETLDGPDGGPKPSSYARCADGAGTLSRLFFSDDDGELARAKAICRTCGLADDCLRGAIQRVEPYGVWGGKLVLDGVPVEFKRKRGRPPKQPKPVLVVDEVPLPDWVA